jgi:hypothetical protein
MKPAVLQPKHALILAIFMRRPGLGNIRDKSRQAQSFEIPGCNNADEP